MPVSIGLTAPEAATVLTTAAASYFQADSLLVLAGALLGAALTLTLFALFRSRIFPKGSVAGEPPRDDSRLARMAAAAPGVLCSFRLSPEGVPTFPYASAAIRELYGRTPEELANDGSIVFQLMHPDDVSHVNESISESARTMRLWRDEFRISHPQKGELWIEGHSMPRLEADGIIEWHGHIHDITDRKRMEEALRQSLAEKEVLLKEVHHRVKNNLQIVANLLNLRANHATDRQVIGVLQDMAHRVRSMALLHEMLYRSESLARVDFAAYVGEMCHHIARSSAAAAAHVHIDCRVAAIGLPIEQSVACGLIINELVSNALKHGFPDGRRGTIRVELRSNRTGLLVLQVSDDGVGPPSGFDPDRTATLGLKLVSGLADQLHGDLLIACPEGGGAVFTVTFPVPEGASPDGDQS